MRGRGPRAAAGTAAGRPAGTARAGRRASAGAQPATPQRHDEPEAQPRRAAPAAAPASGQPALTAAPAAPRAAGRSGASPGRPRAHRPAPTPGPRPRPAGRRPATDSGRSASSTSTIHGAATASRAALTVQPCRVSSSARVRASSRRKADSVRSSRPRSLPPTSRAIRSDSTSRSPTGSAEPVLEPVEAVVEPAGRPVVLGERGERRPQLRRPADRRAVPAPPGSDSPARTAEARLSTASGQTSRSSAAPLARPAAHQGERGAGGQRRRSTARSPATTRRQPSDAARPATDARAARRTESAPGRDRRRPRPGPAVVRRARRDRVPRAGRVPARGGQNDHQTQDRPEPRTAGRQERAITPQSAAAVRRAGAARSSPARSNRSAVRREAVARGPAGRLGWRRGRRSRRRRPRPGRGPRRSLAPAVARRARVARCTTRSMQRGDGRHDEAGADVLAGQQRQRAHLGRRPRARSWRARVHMPGQAAVQRDQQVEALLLPDLADDDPGRAHPQRLLDQAAQRDLAGALEVGLAALHRDDVGQRRAAARRPPRR